MERYFKLTDPLLLGIPKDYADKVFKLGKRMGYNSYEAHFVHEPSDKAWWYWVDLEPRLVMEVTVLEWIEQKLLMSE